MFKHDVRHATRMLMFWFFFGCCCCEEYQMQVGRCCRCDQDIIRVVRVWMNKNNNKDKDTVDWGKGELLLQLPSSISAQRKFVVFVVRIFLAIFFISKLTGLSSFVRGMHQDITRVVSSTIEIQLRSTETRNLCRWLRRLLFLLVSSQFSEHHREHNTSK